MNIGLFGYGKMGKMLENLGTDRGHTIVAKIDVDAQSVDFGAMDVAIDFSTPESAYNNIKACIDHGVPVVSGTTGWLENYESIKNHCQEKKGAFIYASNFSLGVNLFFELNAQLAKMMAEFKEYKVSMEEIHHTQKLDAPSGTAITLAEGIIKNTDYKNWILDEQAENEITITSKRIGDTPGTHVVGYDNEIDNIEIKHTAHNRKGFALGAIIAAEWLVGKQGVFTMKDVLGIN